MKDFEKKPIIVPWDFSEMSKNAFLKAMEIAASPDQIEVVHVTPYPSAVEPSVIWGTYSEDDIRESLQNSFRKEIANAKFEKVRFTALFGDPGSRIARLAEERGAGLIVISSHGRTGLTRMLVGSVAERVVRLAPCPVLVLRS
jgi:nucleotide-binding universal stress UspA family protein